MQVFINMYMCDYMYVVCVCVCVEPKNHSL